MMKTPQRELHDYISEISERADVRAGSPLPLGTQERGGGVNFAIFSRDASRVRLELFDHSEDAAPARVIDLELSSFQATRSCSGAEGSYPRADAKSHGGSREIAVAKGSRRSLLKLNRCPSLGS